MKRWALLATIIVFGGGTLLALAGKAVAANRPDPQLDAAASFIAGKAETVWCETDWPNWFSLEQQNGVNEANGFTNQGTSVVYVAPDVCEYLHALIERRDVGSFFAADAMLTLAHESVHQRGILDEGVTDCMALGLVSSTATTFFGIPKTVTKAAVRYVWRRLSGRRVRVPTLNYTQVPNPFLSRLLSDAKLWHAAKGSAYQGGC